MSFNPSAAEAVNLLEGYFYWNGFPKLLGCPDRNRFQQADIALIGLPLAINPIERTQYLAPRAVRHRSQAYHRSHREFGVDPFELARICDFGDVPIPTPTLADQAAIDIEKFYARMDAAGTIPFTIGGDHACTLPGAPRHRGAEFASQAAGGYHPFQLAHQLLRQLRRRPLPCARGLDIVGGDIVCFVPHLDPSQITALHINGIMHDLVTIMAEGVAGKKVAAGARKKSEKVLRKKVY